MKVAEPATVIVPDADEARETVGFVTSGGTLTVRVNGVVRVSPPPVAVTVTVEFPVGVEGDVVRVIVEEQLGAHEVGENEAVVPVGSPEAENETDWDAPDTMAALTELVTDEP